VAALALLCKASAQPGADFVTDLKSLGVTWSEAAALLGGMGSGGVAGTWGKTADAAKTLVEKAKGDASAALKKAMELAKEVGVTWTERLAAVTTKDLSSSAGQDESALKAAVSAPSRLLTASRRLLHWCALPGHCCRWRTLMLKMH
jgi:hypothetical protein